MRCPSLFKPSRRRRDRGRRAPSAGVRCRLVVLEDRLLPSSFLVRNTNDIGDGSLRQAIQSANAQAGTDIIEFSIGGAGVHSIELLSALPTITDPVVLDGTTQPGFTSTPLIELNGIDAGAGVSGLTISAGDSLIKGLAINRFDRDGIQITTRGGNQLRGNFIGTDPAGTSALGNRNDGVEIIGCSANRVGGASPGAANLLSGNGHNGLTVLGLDGAPATGNLVVGNTIGTDITGGKALANAAAGVSLSNAAGTTVGGTSAKAGNVISGNGADGVLIGGSAATGNVLQGNKIGTDVAGTARLQNGSHGVEITAASNTVGGTDAGAGNLISGNPRDGVLIANSGATGNVVQGNFIGTDAAGAAGLNNGTGVAISGAANNTVGGRDAGAGNLISGNSTGLLINNSGATGNVIQGNKFGTNAAGTATLANTTGVDIENAANNTVGGTAAGAGNLIAGHFTGFEIRGSGATRNVVQGNRIGTNAFGTFALPNGDGVVISGAVSNTVGGTAAGAGNIISGNFGTGVAITDSGATGNVVQGNLIGTDATGTTALGNFWGVEIFNAANNTVGGTAAGAGNLISANGRDGVVIAGNATGNLVQGNKVGTNAAGSASLANGTAVHLVTGTGVNIDNSANNTVGGTAAGAGNLISGNSTVGVLITGSGATGNLLQGNQIGTNAAGTGALGNSLGVLISGAASNTVGGTAVGAGNLISGNGTAGVRITDSGATGNVLQGNQIGTNAAGTGALSNSLGVVIAGAAKNTVGGTAAGAGNLISGNGVDGIRIGIGTSQTLVQGNRIGTNAAGTASLANGTGVDIQATTSNTVGGAAVGAGNLISGNTLFGVAITGVTGSASGNVVQGNQIGTNAAGTAGVGNAIGVFLSGTIGITVGGTAVGAGNLISGNTNTGLLINLTSASGNLVQGNRVGTNATGTASLTNPIGVDIDNSANNTVGGTAAGAGNLISGNAGDGLLIANSGATGNVVQGNLIGTNAAGTASLANAIGVDIQTTASNTVGGTAAGAGNIISGNTNFGISISFASGNLVHGNKVGTDLAGAAKVGNGVGVRIFAAASNTVGGSAAGAGNLISGNALDGVVLSGVATGNMVQNNKIGTDIGGAANLGNGGAGVSVLNTSANTVGGSATGTGNTIAFNGGAGVAVTGFPSTGNRIQRNAIFDNGGLGIDLGNNGLTPNDLRDIDTGPNTLQNFPSLTTASTSNILIQTSVAGTFNGTPTTTFTLEFFASPSADPSGFGEGKTYLGSSTVTTSFLGLASFQVNLFAVTSPGSFITATATGPGGNTSEFSPAVVINTAAAFKDRTVTSPIKEGDRATVSGTITDPDPRDPFRLVVTWGDGTPAQTYKFPPGSDGKRVSVTHRYRDDGSYTIGLFWTDPLGPGNSATLAVSVLNVAPVVTAGGAATFKAGHTLERAGSFTDPGADRWAATVDYGDGAGPQRLHLKGRHFTLHHKYRKAGTYHVVVRVTDDDGGVGTASFDVTVAPAKTRHQFHTDPAEKAILRAGQGHEDEGEEQADL